MAQVEQTVKNIQTYTLVGGIANAVAFLIGIVLVVGAGVGTFGCGCVLIVFPLANLAASVVDFLAYARLNGAPSPSTFSLVKTSAVLDLCASLALVPLVMGIMKLQLLAAEGVRDYFDAARPGAGQ